ncbi:MAG: hypothetical protein WA890_27105 [Micromonospora sp.]
MNIWVALFAVVVHYWLPLLVILGLVVGLALLVAATLRSASEGAIPPPDDGQDD